MLDFEQAPIDLDWFIFSDKIEDCLRQNCIKENVCGLCSWDSLVV